MGDAVKTAGTFPYAATEAAAERGRSVSRSHLVNRLNYLNFQDQTILVSLRHLVYDDAVVLRARPQPCAGDRLELVWAEIPSLEQLLKTYRFDYLLIADGRKYLVVNTEVVSMDGSGLTLILPSACREFQARRIRRHPASGTTVQMVQHGVLLECELEDFTPVSLRTRSCGCVEQKLSLINNQAPVHLRLMKGGRIVGSGYFGIITRETAGRSCSFVLGQHWSNIRRFKSKTFRNIRQQLVPSPNMVFDHPLIDKRVNLKLSDISGTGFSVEESEGDSVLMTGMMLPEVRISFAQGFSLTCAAQVIFRNVSGGEAERTVRCGLAILDMDIADHVKLLSILHQAANGKSYVCTEVDMDDLWDFFFETGFIYPGKYLQFQYGKEGIKETYNRLYTGNPSIARHFIYLDRGVILGHMAMVRFYRNAWLIHHHAARKSASAKAGLAVLEQVSNYLNELESYAFAHLRYVYCYYRPDNKFPSRIFGGFARTHNDQSTCSEDLFGYGHFTAAKGGESLPPQWELDDSSRFDISELERFYRHVSGGVMAKAFDLQADAPEAGELAAKYRELRFRKESYRYSLRKNGSLKAFFLVNCTDAGFNMADLTNCVTVVILDEEVPPQLIEISLERASRHYEGGGMPVLTFPFSYLERHSLQYEKTYLLWVLDMNYSDAYFHFCDRLFRSAGKGA